MSRMGKPHELGALAVYLASDASSLCPGAVCPLHDQVLVSVRGCRWMAMGENGLLRGLRWACLASATLG